MRLLDHGLLVVLVHLWQGVAGTMKISRDLIPPDWEVGFDHISKVGTVRSWLADQLMENWAGSFPSACLDTHESSNSESNRQSHGPAKMRRSNNWTKYSVGGTPGEERVRSKLT